VVVGANIGALSIIRSLGRKSIPVILLTSELSDYTTRSRYCRKVKCASVEGALLVEKLKEIARSLDHKAVLFCTKDSSVLTVAQYQSQLEELYHFVLPSFETIRQLMSKQHFQKFAENNGFSIPKAYFIKSEEDIEKVGNLIPYPCVIKPEFRDDKWTQQVSKLDKIFRARNKDEYFEFFKTYHLIDYQPIVQEWIDGSDADVYYCLTYLNRSGQPLSIFTGRKIRQFPILTGSTSLAESKWLPQLADQSIKLLQTAHCKGLCSLEFKYSKIRDTFLITEPTVGRVDTQEGSSISSGIDFPYIAYQDALGFEPEPAKFFEEGIRWINEPEDYSSVRNYFKNKELTFRELLASYQGKRSYALKAIDDPLPFISFIGHLLKKGWQRIFYPGN